MILRANTCREHTVKVHRVSEKLSGRVICILPINGNLRVHLSTQLLHIGGLSPAVRKKPINSPSLSDCAFENGIFRSSIFSPTIIPRDIGSRNLHRNNIKL